MNAPDDPQALEFSGFVLDVRQRRLLGPDGAPIAIAARAFDLLLHLARHPGELLDKRRLMNAVWPNVIVEENNLSQHISTLRKLLGEAPGEHRFIITVPGRGVRFVPSVQRLVSVPGAAGAVEEAPRPAQEAPRPALELPPRPTQASPRRSQEAPAEPSSPEIRAENAAAVRVSTASAPEEAPALLHLNTPAHATLASAPSPTVPAPSVPALAALPARRRRVTPVAVLAGLLVLVLLGAAALFFLRPGDKQSATAASEPPSLVVLPFADVSPSQDEANFTDGLSEELMNALGRQQGLRVLGRTSSFSFKGRNEDVRKIAAALDVNHVLEGSVRRDGDKLRITAQLVEASTGAQKWSNTYDGTLSDVFSVQKEIATSVATALRLTLVPEAATAGGTTNIVAYEAYLSARASINHLGSTDARKAIEDLERAVSIDPQFALAWASLAEAYTFAVDFPPDRALPLTPIELQRRISAAALRAFELAPNAPQTLSSAGSVAMQNRDWTEAGRRFRKAVELAPFDFDANNFQAWFFMNVGRPRDAIPYMQRAVRAEPLLLRPVPGLAAVYDMAGDSDKALELLRATGSLQGDPQMAINARISILLGRGDTAALREFFRSSPSLASQLNMIDEPKAALETLRGIYANRNSTDAAGGLYAIVAWAPYLGDPKLALDALRAIGPTQNVFVIWQPAKKPMRRLPEFKNLVRELGLVDYWRTSGNWGEFCRPQGADDFECR